MPELPEVETIRKDLIREILNKKVKEVEVFKSKMVDGGVSNFKKILLGNCIVGIDRIGKLMIFRLKNGGRYLLAHMKMTGQLIYASKGKLTAGGHNFPKLGELPNKYSHIIISFADGSRLFFNDMRQFGYMKIVDERGLKKAESKFGVEPLQDNFSLEKFLESIRGKKTSIKVFLLNQKNVAGIGNIYADEILFDAGIRPSRKIESLSKKDIGKIYLSCNKIIKKAIKKRGTTFSDYVDGNGNKGNFTNCLKVYQRQGKKCKRCKTRINKTKIGGRGTYYCPKCQK